MSELYPLLKLAHIFGATLLFGTGLGTAFFMWRADRSGDVAAIAQTARTVVIADYLFTLPAVIAQPLTGYLLVLAVGYELTEGWILATLGLYVLTGACWLPVVWLQTRMRDLAVEARDAGATCRQGITVQCGCGSSWVGPPSRRSSRSSTSCCSARHSERPLARHTCFARVTTFGRTVEAKRLPSRFMRVISVLGNRALSRVRRGTRRSTVKPHLAQRMLRSIT